MSVPCSKKRKVPRDLPDPLELLASSKAAKKNVKTAFSSLLSIDLLDCGNELLQNLSENEKLAWLIVFCLTAEGECTAIVKL